MKILILSLVLLVNNAANVIAGSLPNDAFSLPVLITCTNDGTGNSETASGFYLNISNHLFLCTARHVLFNKEGNLNYAKAKLLQTGSTSNTHISDITADLAALNLLGQIRQHPKHDVAVVRIAATNGNNGWRWNLRLVATNVPVLQNFLSIQSDFTRRFANVSIGDDVFVFGYPTSIGLQQSPLFDYSAPLLRKGIVSGVYPKEQTIILDSSVYFGNSGGPVLEVDRSNPLGPQFYAIGVVADLIPFVDFLESKRFHFTNVEVSNSGYSVVEPIDFILDLVWD